MSKKRIYKAWSFDVRLHYVRGSNQFPVRNAKTLIYEINVDKLTQTFIREVEFVRKVSSGVYEVLDVNSAELGVVRFDAVSQALMRADYNQISEDI